MTPPDKKKSDELQDLLQQFSSATPFEAANLAKQIAQKTSKAQAPTQAQPDYQELWQKIEPQTDLPQLIADLGNLKNQLKNEASTPEQYDSLAEVARAEEEAKAGNGPRMLMSLQKAGNPASEKAEVLKANVIVETFKHLPKP